jgi:hypothetical protein
LFAEGETAMVALDDAAVAAVKRMAALLVQILFVACFQLDR